MQISRLVSTRELRLARLLYSMVRKKQLDTEHVVLKFKQGAEYIYSHDTSPSSLRSTVVTQAFRLLTRATRAQQVTGQISLLPFFINPALGLAFHVGARACCLASSRGSSRSRSRSLSSSDVYLGATARYVRNVGRSFSEHIEADVSTVEPLCDNCWHPSRISIASRTVVHSVHGIPGIE